MSNNQPDWENIVDQAKDLERMRLLREQNELLEDIASGESSKPGYAERRKRSAASADTVQGVTVIIFLAVIGIIAFFMR
jgi:hypothetical protein